MPNSIVELSDASSVMGLPLSLEVHQEATRPEKNKQEKLQHIAEILNPIAFPVSDGPQVVEALWLVKAVKLTNPEPVHANCLQIVKATHN